MLRIRIYAASCGATKAKQLAFALRSSSPLNRVGCSNTFQNWRTYIVSSVSIPFKSGQVFKYNYWGYYHYQVNISIPFKSGRVFKSLKTINKGLEVAHKSQSPLNRVGCSNLKIGDVVMASLSQSPLNRVRCSNCFDAVRIAKAMSQSPLNRVGCSN